MRCLLSGSLGQVFFFFFVCVCVCVKDSPCYPIGSIPKGIPVGSRCHDTLCLDTNQNAQTIPLIS